MRDRLYWLAAILLPLLHGCQDYPFEFRADRRADGRGIQRLITTQRPIDIIFLFDNSKSMVDELDQVRDDIDIFIRALTESESDYRIAFLAPDLECNIPAARDGCPDGPTSSSCCRKELPACSDSDSDSDGLLDTSTCDGARFRSHDGKQRFYDRPRTADLPEWEADIDRVISAMGCEGSAFEAGLETIRRAVVCSLSPTQQTAAGVSCPDAAVAQLNGGFIRAEAELVIIILTDEDDCSFRDGDTYLRASSIDPVQQAQRLCSPTECYAFVGQQLVNGLGKLDWVARATRPRFECGGLDRLENPPFPDEVSVFVDDLVKVKGSASRIRVGGILGAVQDLAAPLGVRPASCFFDFSPPARTSDQCECWSGDGSDLICEVTAAYRQPTVGSTNYTRRPTTNRFRSCGDAVASGQPGGCQALSGGRYLQFFEQLQQRGAAAAVVDSICQPDFADTLNAIAGAILPTDCFILPGTGFTVENIQVRRNGRVIPNVKDAVVDGWSLAGAELCLKGRFSKNIGDTYEIFALGGN